MKRTNVFKSGYYVIRQRGVPFYEIAEYSSSGECFFLCGDEIPRSADDIGEVITRINPRILMWPPGMLLAFSVFCLILSIVLTLLYVPCE